MIEKISIKVTNILIKNKIIEQKAAAEYIYGYEVLIGKIISFSLLIVIALYLKLLVPSLIFIIFFLALRERSGGFHASTHLRCFIGTVFMYFFCSQILASLLLTKKIFMFSAVAIMSIFIFMLAPINHPNLNLTPEEMAACKKSTRIVLFIELFCILTCTYLGINAVYIVFASMGLIMCAALLILSKITRQEVKE